MHKMNNNSSELFIFNSTISRQIKTFKKQETETCFFQTSAISRMCVINAAEKIYMLLPFK